MHSRTLLLLAALALPVASFAQGSLTPPSAPKPTMKSLDQIEPRRPLIEKTPGVAVDGNGTITISEPGSYYLTGNLTVAAGDGIQINQTGDVTIDLNGFTISSTVIGPIVDRCAIRIIPIPEATTPLANITIRNGHIRGTTTYDGEYFQGGSFFTGIYCHQPVLASCRVSDVTVTGILTDGIHIDGYANSVGNCAVSVCGGTGIYASSVTDSTAMVCGGTGIYATTVADCSAYSTSSIAISGQQVANSSGTSVADTGIQATNATNSCGTSTKGIGLRATTAVGCSGESTLQEGIYATSAQNCRGKSTGATGLLADTAENCFGEVANFFGPTTSGRYGLRAFHSATGCSGSNNVIDSTTAYGLHVDGPATNCRGYTRSGVAGLHAETASNCQGTTDLGTAGLEATIATSCIGENRSKAADTFGIDASISASNSTGSGIVGIRALRSANFCHGASTATAGNIIAITTGQTTYPFFSGTAIGCTSGFGIIIATNKQLGTP